MTTKLSHLSKPLIVILGSTAVGKSKLGIELARLIDGEIISADSMQVYKGLDVITNKVTADEQSMAKHHMINIVDPPKEFTVKDFQKQAMDIISELHEKGKVPVVVGGTNYYIESLMWDFLIAEKAIHKTKNESQCSSTNTSDEKHTTTESINPSGLTETLYKQLLQVDPERASVLHPNEKRKILRSLEIFRTTGKKHSTWLKEQKNTPGSSSYGGALRFENTLVFWITCEQNILDERISKRVDNMLTMGLQEEVCSFYHAYKSTMNNRQSNNTVHESNGNEDVETKQELYTEGQTDRESDGMEDVENKTINKFHGTEDLKTKQELYTVAKNVHESHGIEDLETKQELYTEGLFQAIGFKEFHDYFTYESDDSETKEKLLCHGCEALKRVTIKYSKKQKTWIRNRFLSRPRDSSPNIYQLDSSCIDQWHENVFHKASLITQSFLSNSTIPYEPMERLLSRVDPHKKYICEICNDKIIMGDVAWKQHQVSRQHKRKTKKRNQELK